MYKQRPHTGVLCSVINAERLNSPCECGVFQEALGFPLTCFHGLSLHCTPGTLHDLVSVNSRSVPKFMKRMKVPDYKDKAVFGVPLIVHVQRSGQPLPQSIQQALIYLRSNCLDQVRRAQGDEMPDRVNLSSTG